MSKIFLTLFFLTLGFFYSGNVNAAIFPAVMTGGTAYTVSGTDKIYQLCNNWDNTDWMNPVCIGWINVSGYEAVDTNVRGVTASCADTRHFLVQEPAECQGEGLVMVIPDGALNDRGNSTMGDNLELYCRKGVIRMCLSGEVCPWVSRPWDATGPNGFWTVENFTISALKIAAADGQTCTRYNVLPGDLLANITNGGNYWKGVRDFYCGSASSQKYGNIAFPKDEIYSYCVDDNAAFVSYVDMPSLVLPGEEFTASIKMKNTGNTTWLAGSNYRLGSQNAQDNSTWGLQRINLNSNVGPDQIGIFEATFTAPLALGTYNFQWQMVLDGSWWFGDKTLNNTISVVALAGDGACGAAKDAPKETAPSALLCSMSNASSVTLESNVWKWNCAGGVTTVPCSAPKTCTPSATDFTCSNPLPDCPVTTGTVACVDSCSNSVDVSKCGASCTAQTKLCPAPRKIKSWQEVAPSN